MARYNGYTPPFDPSYEDDDFHEAPPPWMTYAAEHTTPAPHFAIPRSPYGSARGYGSEMDSARPDEVNFMAARDDRYQHYGSSAAPNNYHPAPYTTDLPWQSAPRRGGEDAYGDYDDGRGWAESRSHHHGGGGEARWGAPWSPSGGGDPRYQQQSRGETAERMGKSPHQAMPGKAMNSTSPPTKAAVKPAAAKKPPRQLAPVTSVSNSCTRITVCALSLMCLVWPGLLIAGIVLALASNPQDGQISDFNAAVASFQTSTQPIVLSTTASTVGSSGTTRSLAPQYQLLTGTPFPNTKTAVLYTSQTYVVPSNLGSNQGSLSVAITYKQDSTSLVGQTFSFTTPAIAIKRSAKKEVTCTAAYATICGTTTCCTTDQMTQQCVAIVRTFSQTAGVTYVPNGASCMLGVDCGYCQYDQFVTKLCFVIKWSATSGWAADNEKSSCDYPFLQGNQGYGDSDQGATLTLRSSDDPYIVLQQMTQGTLQLSDDGSNTRNTGRALILFGCLTLLLGGCVVGLAKFCGADVLSIDAVERAFGCKLRRDRNKYSDVTVVNFDVKDTDRNIGQQRRARQQQYAADSPPPLLQRDRWNDPDSPDARGRLQYSSVPAPPPQRPHYVHGQLDDPLL